jgi:transposase
MKQAIEEAGHILLYLLAYSSDLNPIEHKWAQAKKKPRTMRCSVSELFDKYIS